jgi:hypothetical protein
MDVSDFAPGTTMKFPLSVKMEVAKQNKTECALETGPMALTLARGQRTSAVMLHHVPYAPGGINYAATGGPVLSGIFTGCVMTIYNSGGQRRVGHVHTGEHAGAGLDCKALMKGIGNLVFAFKPYDQNADFESFLGIATQHPSHDQGVATFGLVTGANKCYAIFTHKMSVHEYVIKEVKEKLVPYQFA